VDNSDDQYKEKRGKTRVDFSTATEILLKVGSSVIQLQGDSRDLSLKGIFISTEKNIPIGTKCHVEITLSGMTDDLALKMNGSVARKETNGIGINFDSMDLDSYTHLKNIVRYNSGNPDEIY
jgi:hypothetical protein